MSLPVTLTEFWRHRILKAFATGKDLHTCIYDIDYATWISIQELTVTNLKKIIPANSTLLDAGCGYGAIASYLKSCAAMRTVHYTGVDLSPELIEIAKIRNPSMNFLVKDLRSTDYKTDQFDFALVRSVEGMLDDNCTEVGSKAFMAEVSRIAKTVIVMEYGSVSDYKLLRKQTE